MTEHGEGSGVSDLTLWGGGRTKGHSRRVMLGAIEPSMSKDV